MVSDPLPACLDVGRHRILFVMAAAPEYGAHLAARIVPVMTGVGPIEAALATGIALQRLADAGRLPTLVVCLGSAGSRICELGMVYQVSALSWRDIDASLLGFTRGVTPFLDHPPTIALPTPIPGVPTATLSTGGNVVGGDGYAAIDADMVDMESFAVWRACRRFDVPLVGLRGISDGPGQLADMNGWTGLLHVIDERLAAAMDLLVETLTGSTDHNLSSRPVHQLDDDNLLL